MFTGIIEATGIITEITTNGTNKTFWVKSLISNELKVDQSVSHSGVCLTVEEVRNDIHQVTAIQETLSKTNLGDWKINDIVNLERCLMMNGRLDGHMVQGHVDGQGTCTYRKELGGSWEYGFEFPEEFNRLIIEKGSVTIDGISLTAFNVGNNTFSIGVIPYTYEHTNIKNVFPAGKVNLEFDIIGKYILRNALLK
jgi:riboflavin synthase